MKKVLTDILDVMTGMLNASENLAVAFGHLAIYIYFIFIALLIILFFMTREITNLQKFIVKNDEESKYIAEMLKIIANEIPIAFVIEYEKDKWERVRTFKFPKLKEDEEDEKS